jgi:hypothetical protein
VIDNLPTLSGQFLCAFTALDKTLITNATRKSYGVNCTTPRTDLLPSIPQGQRKLTYLRIVHSVVMNLRMHAYVEHKRGIAGARSDSSTAWNFVLDYNGLLPALSPTVEAFPNPFSWEKARGSVVGWGTMLQAMALGSIELLTEISTRNLPKGKERPACKTDSLPAIYDPIV